MYNISYSQQVMSPAIRGRLTGIQRFDGQDFGKWKIRMQIYLVKETLWEYVNKEIGDRD